MDIRGAEHPAAFRDPKFIFSGHGKYKSVEIVVTDKASTKIFVDLIRLWRQHDRRLWLYLVPIGTVHTRSYFVSLAALLQSEIKFDEQPKITNSCRKVGGDQPRYAAIQNTELAVR